MFPALVGRGGGVRQRGEDQEKGGLHISISLSMIYNEEIEQKF
jgi:hypothetical protein